GQGSRHRDQVFELVETALADTGDLEELVDSGEGVGRAVGDDAVGGDLADAWEGVELVQGGGIEVKGRGRAGARAAHGGGGGRGRGVAGRWPPALFAVGELAGQVDRVEVGARGGAAGGPDGVLDPAPGRQADQAGAAGGAGARGGPPRPGG